jgi:hypothetical protein
MPKLHPRTGLACQNRAEREHWPVGLVTPYGRWLQHPDAGAHGAFASGNCISLVYPPERPGQAERRHPGRQRTVAAPPDQGYPEAYALTPHVIKSQAADGSDALLRLPDLAVLHSGLRSIDYHEDGLIRARRSDDIMLLLDATGQPLFDSPTATCELQPQERPGRGLPAPAPRATAAVRCAKA